MFRNAWNLGKISGIDIRVHWSFLLLPMYVYMTAASEVALLSVLMVLAVFGCVLLHELGHALAARQFGIGTRDIILLPIGGVASLEHMPRNPLQELWIAIAGPLVNVVIAIFLYAAVAFIPLVQGAVGGFLINLAQINLFLVAFNLLPAFPMDGGRVLRSCLAIFMPYVSATVIAATVGKYCAIALGIFAIYYSMFTLILLAGFVYFAGQAEKMKVLYDEHRGRQKPNPFGQPNSRSQFQSAANHGFNQQQATEINVPATLSADSVVAWLANVRAECCNIVESGHIIGRITKSQLLTALSDGMGSLPVGQLMRQR